MRNQVHASTLGTTAESLTKLLSDMDPDTEVRVTLDPQLGTQYAVTRVMWYRRVEFVVLSSGEIVARLESEEAARAMNVPPRSAVTSDDDVHYAERQIGPPVLWLTIHKWQGPSDLPRIPDEAARVLWGGGR